MAVKLFFGLPGSGKTTILAKLALDGVRSKRYRNVYSNIRLQIPGVIYIDNACIGKYVLEDGLILIDEATLYADSRDHKSFSEMQKIFFLEHRHFNVDIVLFTQQWDGVDRKIRVITDRVFYVYKGFFTGRWFSRYYPIPYGIIIPDPKQGHDKLGEIVQGYCKPNFFVRLFSPWVFRPQFYKYFDSWSRPPGFLPLPPRYKPFYQTPDQIAPRTFVSRFTVLCNKASILLRSVKRGISGAWQRLRSLFVKDKKSID